MSGELEALAVRCEQATGEEGDMLECIIEARRLIDPRPKPSRQTGPEHADGGLAPLKPETVEWQLREQRFNKLACAGAYLEAAVTLIPEGDDWLRKDFRTMTVVQCGSDMKMWGTHIDGAGATPALALCAASLRARAHSQESTTHAS